MLIEIILFLTCLGALFVYKVKRKYRYFKERGVPFVQPTFLFGNTFPSMIGWQQVTENFTELSNQLKGHKYGGIFQFLSPVYLIRDPEYVQKILVKDFSYFHDRGFRIDEEVNPLEGHLFALSGEKWRFLRNKLSPTFTSGKLKRMLSLMDSCSNMMLQSLENKAGADTDMAEVLACFTTDVIGSCVFGYEPTAINDPECDFRRKGKELFSPTFYELVINSFRVAFPNLFFPLKIKTVRPDLEDFFTRVITEGFEHRKRTGERRNDFIDLLLQLKEKGQVDLEPEDAHEETVDVQTSTKIDLTDALLTAQAFVFFIAGFETSATAMSWTLYFLARDQQLQARAREEIRAQTSKYGGFTSDALKGMEFLDACIKEALRLFPPIGVLLRECSKSYKLDDNVTIEKGVSVAIPFAAIHRDPHIFPEPNTYNPDRFLKDTFPPGSYIPFGDGPRICIGRRFALQEAKIGLARILDRFTVDPSPKQQEPIKIDPKVFLQRPLGGIWFRFTKCD